LCLSCLFPLLFSPLLSSAAARLVSYDVIDGTVLDDIRKHEERQASLQKMASLAEGDERSPARNITPPQPKKGMRTGRKSRAGSGVGGGLGFGANDDPLGRSSSSVSDHTPTSELHERLTQEAMVALELEAFTLQTNKQVAAKEEKKESSEAKKNLLFCCFC
jgi:hypothetical protein